MYYEVLAKKIEYLDTGGEMVMALKGKVVLIDRRPDAVRLKKEGAIRSVEDNAVAIDSTFTLTPDQGEPIGEDDGVSGAHDDEQDNDDDSSGDPKKGDLVHVVVDEQEQLAEVITAHKNGTYSIKLAEDESKHTIEADKVMEVLG